MAHIGQSRPHSGLDFQVKALKIFEVVPGGTRRPPRWQRQQQPPLAAAILPLPLGATPKPEILYPKP